MFSKGGHRLPYHDREHIAWRGLER
jgi:hypothetical protein